MKKQNCYRPMPSIAIQGSACLESSSCAQGANATPSIFPLLCSNVRRSLSLIAISMCATFFGASVQAGTIYTTALYYDHWGKLVQMEDLETKESFAGTGRVLQDISEWQIPRMTPKSKQYGCTSPGVLIPLAGSARFAIYYGYDSSTAEPRSVEPLRLEHLAGVPRKGQQGVRMIKCEKIYDGGEGDACVAPKHCLSTCAGAPTSCPSYCCVP